MNINDNIEAAKSRFDKELHSDTYKKIHSDDAQLNLLIDMVKILPGKNYLDIGTGNGYVANALAKINRNITVIGLDIAEESINKNNELSKHHIFKNTEFVTYDGIKFPFNDSSFYGSLSRYAFHHFPDPNKTVNEIYRILEKDGFFILSDPETDFSDEINFVDTFQKQINDGHIHFYREEEIVKIFEDHNFILEKLFRTNVTYPREINQKYLDLFEMTNKSLLDKYKIKIYDDKVYITVSVMNILFRKS